MEDKAGAQISRKAFIQSFLILLALMVAAGVVSRLVPAGSYSRSLVDGRQVIDPNSFQFTPRPDYPVWRWITAPVEVLWGPDGITVIGIIIFILLVGIAFALLDSSGILKAAIGRIVRRFEKQKYLLLAVVSLFFMLLGAFFGILEEVVPLIPIMLALSYLLGWDALVGLGMSILATNMGFSSAISNPFTVSLGQKLGGLPLFSGWWFRLPFFIIVYAIFVFFLTRYARRIERCPEDSPVFEEDRKSRERYAHVNMVELESGGGRRMGAAITWFGVSLVLILVLFIATPFVPFLSDYALLIVGLLFLISGIGASLITGQSGKSIGKAALQGMGGLAPGIPLILMAMSVKYIIASGGVLDTVLYKASGLFSGEGTFLAALLVFIMALLMEFFVSSGSAKVFLMMPILFPLGDLVGLTRQTVLTAYCFGDGFTNMIYPTNAMLLISLGLASIPYSKWLRWSAKLWLWVLPVVLVFLAIAVAIHFGPF